LTYLVINHPNGNIMGAQTWQREKFVHEAMYRSHEMRVAKQLLAHGRIPKALFDFSPRNVSVGEYTNPTSRLRPFPCEDGQFRYEQRGLPAAGTGFDIKRRSRL
jgi:hypothetical protein